MIQDIAPSVFHNQYVPKSPEKDSCVLIYEKNSVLVTQKEDGSYDFPDVQTVKKENKTADELWIYLFEIDQKAYYMIDLEKLKMPPQYQFKKIGFFSGKNPRYFGFAAITGYQLHRWYDSRRFCGRCGQPLKHSETERMLYCEKCGQMEFPKISPGVIVGVTNGSKLLLSKYAGRNYTRYALLAGFTEIGESLEETVKREVMEEVGLKVKNIRYYKNQPWSYSDSLLVGFFCDVDTSDEIHLDETELSMAEWFEREDIPLEDDPEVSLTHEMIRYFKEG